MPCLFIPLLRLFDYEGRSRRREFWSYCWAAALALTLAVAWDVHTRRGHAIGGMAGPLTVVTALLLGLPLAAATVRRLHDTGRTAGVLLVNLLPGVGQLATLWWLAQAGQRGANRFGIDPRGAERMAATMPIKPGFVGAGR